MTEHDDAKLEAYRARAETWKLSIGSALDEILSGGVESGTITQIYGPPGVGKTNLCLLYTVSAVRQGKRVIFIDTEGGHSLERVRQIAGDDYKRVLERAYFYEANTFEEQCFIVENIEHVLTEDFGLIILDSAVSLYRLDRAEESIGALNRALSRQMATLMALARRYNLPVIITNQVYSAMNGEGVEPIGGDVLKYWSKAILEIMRQGKVREAVLRRHRSLPEGLKARFVVTEQGIKDV
ncbi:DNA repair and recombination protein RadB [Candidatus Pyrohabitans sp.]